MAEYIEREAVVKILRDEAKAAYPTPYHIGLYAASRAIDAIPAADVRPVVTCGECKWWTKQEASLQGRCELLKMYPTGAWFCANGKREES